MPWQYCLELPKLCYHPWLVADEGFHALYDEKKMYIVMSEECADTNWCGLNTNFQPTNITIKMDCATWVMWLDISSKYINQSDRGLTKFYIGWVALWVSILSTALASHTQYSALYKSEEIKCWPKSPLEHRTLYKWRLGIVSNIIKCIYIYIYIYIYIWQNHKFHRKFHGKPEGGINRGRIDSRRGIMWMRHFPGRYTLATAILYINDAARLHI